VTEDLRFPIGKFTWPESVTAEDRERYIGMIAEAPKELRAAVAGLSEVQLDTPYREGGWTVRQVVHHVPESHMNSYIRFKLALTEENPVVKPYDEDAWAKLTMWLQRRSGSFVHPAIGPVYAGEEFSALCLAWAAPCGSCCAASEAQGLVAGKLNAFFWF
jgi:hypothetical protein